MLHWLQKKFGFSKKELRGLMVLMLLVATSWLIPLIYEAYQEPEPLYFERVAAAERVLPSPEKEVLTPSPLSYFPFDPNHLSVEAWKKLGLRDGQIKNIKNFEAKGGRFYKKEDLKKIYSISADDYNRLEPYIQLEQPSKEVVNTGRRDSSATDGLQARSPQQSAPTVLIELNTADSISLLALPGIGPVFASRIVRYRKLLGGFYGIEQLREVYGMDSLRYQQVKPMLSLDRENLTRIAINTVDVELLRKHPYIKDKYARLIVAYREQHGAFKKIEDLLGIVLIDPDYLRKIAPYLIINDD